MVFDWPQMVWLFLAFAGLVIAAFSRDGATLAGNIIGTLIMFGLLYAGGFFAGHC